jgi:hypothetical protein
MQAHKGQSHQYLTNVQSWNIRFGRQTKVYFNEFAAIALCDKWA